MVAQSPTGGPKNSPSHVTSDKGAVLAD